MDELEFVLRFRAGQLMATKVTLFEFDAGRVPMKSLMDGRGTLTEGGLVLGLQGWERMSGICIYKEGMMLL